jgi:hypothetical protein
MGHGQIGCLADSQRYFDKLSSHQPLAISHRDEKVDIDLVCDVFLKLRTERGDRGTTDLYVADPERNSTFLNRCRKCGIKASDYKINKSLYNARKDGYLRNLKSIKTTVKYGAFAFASEFAATDLRYTEGSSIDDILCDPLLASKFDSIASAITPGFTPFEYRWGILSIRKSGRHNKLEKSFEMPAFKDIFRVVSDPIEQIPRQRGVYLLYENQKLLYTKSTENLRQSIDAHRNPNLIRAITETLWMPDPKSFIAKFEEIDRPIGYLQAIERRIVEERHPVFNVQRRAA